MRLLTGLLVLGCSLLPAVSRAEVVTDEKLKQYLAQSPEFESAHAVMTAQRQKLHAALDGFLVGDAELVREATGSVADAMKAVANQIPLKDEQGTEAWSAMSRIVQESLTAEDLIQKNDYVGAYNAYARMTAQCIRCHQTVRDYGTFATAPPEPSEK
jgi:hypothetical protein